MTAPVARVLRQVGLLFFLALVAFPLASGHAYLEASTPDANGALASGAGVVALRFTELVDPDHVTVDLHGADGTPVATTLTFPSQRPYEVRVESEPLPRGEYTLDWRVLGVDGHPASGSLRFSVGAAGVSEVLPPQPYDPDHVDATLVAVEAVGRGIWMLGLLVVLGVPVFVTEIAAVKKPPRRVAVTMAAAGAVGLAGGLLTLAVLAQVVGGSLWAAVTSTPGLFLVGKMGLLAVATGLALVAARPGTEHRTWALASILPAFVATVMHSMGGHGLLAPSSGEGVGGHVGMTLHLVVAGLWIGGVAGFLLLLPGLDRDGAAVLIRRFSPLALASVVVVAATGLYQALIHFPPGARGDLYLALLLGKAALLAVLVLFGAWHMFWLRPRLEQGGRKAGVLRRSLGGESVFLVAVVAVAGLLAAVPVPAAAPGGQGPLAVEESEAPLGDYTARVAVFGNPVVTDPAHDLVIDLHARTSRGVGLADLEVHRVSPDGDVSPITAVQADGDGRWTATVAFPGPGTWGIQVTLQEPSRDVHTFPVRVLEPPPPPST